MSWLLREDRRTTEVDVGCVHPGPVQNHTESTKQAHSHELNLRIKHMALSVPGGMKDL